MPKILNLKDKKLNSYPLIEIMGAIDVGKTSIAQLVSKRLNAPLITFPVLDPTTITGRGLLSTLSTMPRALEARPYWWAHLYVANLYEQATKIQESLKEGPVVVTNYILGYRIWMKSLEIDISSFTKTLPEPNIAYLISGKPIVHTVRPKFDFSPELVLRLQRSFAATRDSRIHRIKTSDYHSSFQHVHMNNICKAITHEIADKYLLTINESEVYSADSFLKKKDL